MILGCTHYPLIRSLPVDLLPGIGLVDPASHTADELRLALLAKNLLADSREPATCAFYATDLNQQSENIVRRIFTDHPLKSKYSGDTQVSRRRGL